MNMPPLGMYLLNAFLIVVVIIPLLQRNAARLGLLDLPKGRKMHDGAIPLTGGIAMFAAFLVPAMNLQLVLGAGWELIAGLGILVALGVADDAFDINPWMKLCGQAAAAAIMTVPHANFLQLGQIVGSEAAIPAFLALPLTIFFIVGIINAFNMIDGLDGLAGGAAATALAWIVFAAWLSGAPNAVAEPMLILFAVLGFLIFNLRHRWRPRASVFMGDAGSMMLGGAIAFFAIRLALPAAEGQPSSAVPPLPAILWFFALPAFDTLLLIARRLADGQNPLVGDRRHLHHLLLQAGLPPERATAGVIAANGVLGGIGFAGWQLGMSGEVMAAALALPLLMHGYFVCRGWRHLQRLLLRETPSAEVAQFPADAFPGEAFTTVRDRAA